MDEARRSDPLLWWAAGSWHATAFLLLVLGIAHANDALGGLTATLDTTRGLVLGAVLWAASVWAARAALRAEGKVWAPAALGGGIVGVAFLWTLALVVLLKEGFEWGSLVVLVFASPFALGVGGLVGVLFAIVDRGLVALVDRTVAQGSQEE